MEKLRHHKGECRKGAKLLIIKNYMRTFGQPQSNTPNKTKSHLKGGFRFPTLENSNFRWKFHYMKFIKSHKYMILMKFLGWLMGLEPTTTGITILDSTN